MAASFWLGHTLFVRTYLCLSYDDWQRGRQWVPGVTVTVFFGVDIDLREVKNKLDAFLGEAVEARLNSSRISLAEVVALFLDAHYPDQLTRVQVLDDDGFGAIVTTE